MDSSGEIFDLSSFFFSIIMFSANSRTWQIATWRRFWEPILRSLWIFQNIRKGSRNRSALVWTASSKAFANSACGKDGDKYSGSYPKAVLQMLTNANRCSISWRSRTVLSAAAAERIWNKAIGEFSFDDGFDKFAERLGIEFVARNLSL